MASDARTKRMMRERGDLEKNTTDYFVHFSNDDLFNFDAYVFGPDDTLYEHKLIKLRFTIPPRYPFVPPLVKFIEHDSARIHPNLYVEGKVCLSILGTWPGEPWAFAMNCNTVLITIRSLLDNKPYMHEPNKPDNPEFNKFVQYATWKCCLLDYIDREEVPALKQFLQHHVRDGGAKMLADLAQQEAMNRGLSRFSSPYGVGRMGSQSRSWLLTPNYAQLTQRLKKAIDRAAPVDLSCHDTATSSPGFVATVSSSFSTIATAISARITGTKRTLEEGHEPSEVKRRRGQGDNLPTSAQSRPIKMPPKLTSQASDVIDLTDD